MMNLVALDSLLAVVLVIVLIFLPKISQKNKRHIDFLVGGNFNFFVLFALTFFLSKFNLPLTSLFGFLLLLETHNRVNLTEHFRAYFGLKRVC